MSCCGIVAFSVDEEGRNRWRVYSDMGGTYNGVYLPGMSGVTFVGVGSSRLDAAGGLNSINITPYFPFFNKEKIVHIPAVWASSFGINDITLENLDVRQGPIVPVKGSEDVFMGIPGFGSNNNVGPLHGVGTILYTGDDGSSHISQDPGSLGDNMLYIVQGGADKSRIAFGDIHRAVVGDNSYLIPPRFGSSSYAIVGTGTVRIFYEDFYVLSQGQRVFSLDRGITSLIANHSGTAWDTVYRAHWGNVVDMPNINTNIPQIFVIGGQEVTVGANLSNFPYEGDTSEVLDVRFLDASGRVFNLGIGADFYNATGFTRIVEFDYEIDSAIWESFMQLMQNGKEEIRWRRKDTGEIAIFYPTDERLEAEGTKYITLRKGNTVLINGNARNYVTNWVVEHSVIPYTNEDVPVYGYAYASDGNTGQSIYGGIIKSHASDVLFLSIDKYTGELNYFNALSDLLAGANVAEYIASQYDGTFLDISNYSLLPITPNQTQFAGQTFINVRPNWTSQLVGGRIWTPRGQNHLTGQIVSPTIYHFNQHGDTAVAIFAASYSVSTITYVYDERLNTVTPTYDFFNYIFLGEVTWNNGSSSVREYTSLRYNPRVLTARNVDELINFGRIHHMFFNVGTTRWRSTPNYRYAVEQKEATFLKIANNNIGTGRYGTARGVRLRDGLNDVIFISEDFIPNPAIGIYDGNLTPSISYSESFVHPANIYTGYNTYIDDISRNVFIIDTNGNIVYSDYIPNTECVELSDNGNLYVAGKASTNNINIVKSQGVTQLTQEELIERIEASGPKIQNQASELLQMPAYVTSNLYWLIPDFNALNSFDGSVNLMFGNYRFNVGLTEHASSIESRLRSLGLNVRVFGTRFSDCKPLIIAGLDTDDLIGFVELSSNDAVTAREVRAFSQINDDVLLVKPIFSWAVSGLAYPDGIPSGISKGSTYNVTLDYSCITPKPWRNTDGTFDFITNIGYEKLSNKLMLATSGNPIYFQYVQPDFDIFEGRHEVWKFCVKNSESSINAQVANFYKVNIFGREAGVHAYGLYYEKDTGYYKSYPNNCRITSLDIYSEKIFCGATKFVDVEAQYQTNSYDEEYNKFILGMDNCNEARASRQYKTDFYSDEIDRGAIDRSGEYPAYGLIYVPHPDSWAGRCHGWKIIDGWGTNNGGDITNEKFRFRKTTNATPGEFFIQP